MRQKKKNKLYTFLLSFVPGGAEMYMGFMKMGFSIMLVFMISAFGVLTMANSIFFYTSLLVWFYGFFHARNLAACEEEEFFKIKDDFIWEPLLEGQNIQISNPALRKVAAGILIVFGTVMLWQNISSLLYRWIPDYLWEVLAPIVQSVPEIVIAIIIIYIGVRMIQGKREELSNDDNE